MHNPLWFNTLAWAGAVALALMLAFAAPSESNVMGRLPTVTATGLDRPVTLPHGLPSDRTLALVVFSKRHHAQAESWIEGLQLRGPTAISWVRMPVLDDPGDEPRRDALKARLRARYADDSERARLLAVLTDRAAFIRSVGLDGPHSAYAIVVNRNGEVLARAQGEFHQDRAAALIETLLEH